jgi:hypothetical protein
MRNLSRHLGDAAEGEREITARCAAPDMRSESRWTVAKIESVGAVQPNSCAQNGRTAVQPGCESSSLPGGFVTTHFNRCYWTATHLAQLPVLPVLPVLP